MAARKWQSFFFARKWKRAIIWQDSQKMAGFILAKMRDKDSFRQECHRLAFLLLDVRLASVQKKIKLAGNWPFKAACRASRKGFKGYSPYKFVEVKQRRILQTISQPVPESRLISSLPDRLQKWGKQRLETERQILTEDQYSTVQWVKNIEE